jgi:hypothetical protein
VYCLYIREYSLCADVVPPPAQYHPSLSRSSKRRNRDHWDNHSLDSRLSAITAHPAPHDDHAQDHVCHWHVEPEQQLQQQPHVHHSHHRHHHR